MLGALLAGVRRALPYARGPDNGGTRDASGAANGPAEGALATTPAAMATHANALFCTLHKAPLSVAVQGLALLFALDPGDRFYRALYAVLLSPAVRVWVSCKKM